MAYITWFHFLYKIISFTSSSIVVFRAPCFASSWNFYFVMVRSFNSYLISWTMFQLCECSFSVSYINTGSPIIIHSWILNRKWLYTLQLLQGIFHLALPFNHQLKVYTNLNFFGFFYDEVNKYVCKLYFI